VDYHGPRPGWRCPTMLAAGPGTPMRKRRSPCCCAVRSGCLSAYAISMACGRSEPRACCGGKVTPLKRAPTTAGLGDAPRGSWRAAGLRASADLTRSTPSFVGASWSGAPRDGLCRAVGDLPEPCACLLSVSDLCLCYCRSYCWHRLLPSFRSAASHRQLSRYHACRSDFPHRYRTFCRPRASSDLLAGTGRADRLISASRSYSGARC